MSLLREQGLDGLQSGAQTGDKGLLPYLWPATVPRECDVAPKLRQHSRKK